MRPLRQRIELRTDPDQPDYSGSVSIDLEVSSQTDSFAFHAEEMTLQRVELHSPENLHKKLESDFDFYGSPSSRPMMPARHSPAGMSHVSRSRSR